MGFSKVISWKTQIRKGYLDLCLLSFIEVKGKAYGFELIEELKKLNLPIKEGTLYPILNRMTNDGVLSAQWHTKLNKGHPRKFYSLTKNGKEALKQMNDEFSRMISIHKEIKDGGIANDDKQSS